MMNSVFLIDFTTKNNLADWQIVNDGVMGGRSSSSISLNKAGNAVFSGDVSLENYGGFASVRHAFDQLTIKGSTKFILNLKGDGKRYQFRVKSEISDRHAYIYYFNTTTEWQQIEIPLDQMYASFRGQKLNMPDFAAQKMAEISFLIANGKQESFELEIRKIELH